MTLETPKFKLTRAVAEIGPIWRAKVRFMHGDADSYTYEEASFSTIEELAVLKSKLDEYGRLRQQHWNFMRRAEDRGTAIRELKYYTVADRPATEHPIYLEFDAFLGDSDSISDLFESMGLEVPGDSTNDHSTLAKIDNVIYDYVDEQGNRFILEWE